MSQAVRKSTTLTMLDAIAPNRTRFTVITNPGSAANCPVVTDLPKEPRNPYINHYGKILDPEKAARWNMERVRQRQEANPAPAFHPVRDMPRCQWAGGHRWDSDGCCMDCGQPRKAVR